ncbi:hypothetical protein DL765_003887 [Monosporascus sp. GIB2]|nr:hypothetical protein DL765_003887 [Monosporascus sp. GIB2]
MDATVTVSMSSLGRVDHHHSNVNQSPHLFDKRSGSLLTIGTPVKRSSTDVVKDIDLDDLARPALYSTHRGRSPELERLRLHGPPDALLHQHHDAHDAAAPNRTRRRRPGRLLRRERAQASDEPCTTTVRNRVTTMTTTSTVTSVETVPPTARTIAVNRLRYKRYTHSFVSRAPSSPAFKRRAPVAEGVLTPLRW